MVFTLCIFFINYAIEGDKSATVPLHLVILNTVIDFRWEMGYLSLHHYDSTNETVE